MKNEKLFVVDNNQKKDYKERLIRLIRRYEDEINVERKQIKVEQQTSYFENNDVWKVEEICEIEQFKIENEKYNLRNRIVHFKECSDVVILEMKAVFHMKLMQGEWTLKTFFSEKNYSLERFITFLTEQYPNLKTLQDINVEEGDFRWINWLQKNNINIMRQYKKRNQDKVYESRSSLANFLKSMVEDIHKITNQKEEWDKDRWDVRNLSHYGLYFNETISRYTLNFESILNETFKQMVKKYCKERLIKNNNFTWGTASRTVEFLSDFFNFIHQKEYSLHDFSRDEFVGYLEYVRKGSANNKNPSERFNRSISIVRRFLEDIQQLEWGNAPKKDIQHIIYQTDKMKVKQKAKDNIKYIPDYVLDQLILHLNELPRDVQMVISLMIHSGLRVSDVLRLTQESLVKINEKYWIETDIEKTNVKNHKVPIDENTALTLAAMIEDSKKQSTSTNNPKNYIFCNYEGKRKGLPLEQRYISTHLNHLAKEEGIVDERGQLWKFKNHSFRHTYAVKLINNGVSLTVVQDLLAHASPEMTLTYARLVDDTKRKEWEKAYDNGAFRFDDSGKSVDVNLEEMATDEGLKWEWIRHNLDAVKVSHGFCFISAKQGCKYQTNPCLNANGGKPCKHLAVTPDFKPIYEIDIEMKKKIIEEGKLRGDEYKHWVKKNELELNRVEEIYEIIKNGETFFQKKDTICGKGEEICPLTNNNN